MRKKQQKLGGKFFAALVLVIVMFATVIVISYKDGKKAENQQKEAAAQLKKEKQVLSEDAGADTQNDNDQLQATYINITNTEEFIQPILGNRTYKLSQELGEYMQNHKIDADKATCLDCNIPLDNPEVTEFYIELEGEEDTLVTVTYSPDSGEIKISDCKYTRKEIDNAVWLLNNGPAVKDAEE